MSRVDSKVVVPMCLTMLLFVRWCWASMYDDDLAVGKAGGQGCRCSMGVGKGDDVDVDGQVDGGVACCCCWCCWCWRRAELMRPMSGGKVKAVLGEVLSRDGSDGARRRCLGDGRRRWRATSAMGWRGDGLLLGVVVMGLVGGDRRATGVVWHRGSVAVCCWLFAMLLLLACCCRRAGRRRWG